ncbi:MAG: hypothetical protein JWM78_3421 [Verrucomicrobiaceae bacterium]|nr:hypothetical protein [Verrucomicrobiaceae bacterium]
MNEQATSDDWVSLKAFAPRVGFSVRAIESKKQRGQLPEGIVWIKVGGNILLSLNGWNSWVANQARAQLESQSKVIESSSDSHGTASASAKPSRRRLRHRKILSAPIIYKVT